MSSNAGYSVLVVDDNAFNRQGVCWYLQQQGYETWEAGDEATAWEMAVTHLPQVAVIDIVIPPAPDEPVKVKYSLGVRLATRLKRAYPAMGVVLFSAYEDRGSAIFDLVREGTRGIAYKLKGRPPADLLRTMHDVLAGRVVIDAEVTNSRLLAAGVWSHLTPAERPWVKSVVAHLSQLTPREKEVVQRLAASHNIGGIAASLSITRKTAENYITQIYKKLALSEMAIQEPRLRQAVILAKGCLIAELQDGGET